ncbi:MAG: hypothetical protein HY709_03325 [Candidatus Latescibacteria bacterium]|nr:hypothetical protein [Candidatus Latescibacterota bacterium]
MVEVVFDDPGKPIPSGKSTGQWSGEWASQSPLNNWHRAIEGGGAEGNPAYCALVGEDADQFYAESTPNWWTPSTTFDLRDTRVSLYLKAVLPITVAPGYHPHLFVVNGYRRPQDGCGLFRKEPLRVGEGEWVLHEIELRSDEKLWGRYTGALTIDEVLRQAGFIGVMYLKEASYTGVHATGVLGIDRFRYGMPR